MGQSRRLEGLAALLPYFWLLVFFLAPFAIILKISFADPVIASPPFTALIERATDGAARLQVTLDNYRYLFEDRLYVLTYLNSVKLAFISTLLCLLIGYPMAYAIARARSTIRTLLLLLVILPFWISFLLRVYAWIGILSTHGLLNRLLLAIGVIDQPLQIMYTNVAVYIGIVYSYLPFMILPLYANLERMDLDLRAAAADLGARPWQVFLDVTLPLSMPGIIAGSLLVFIPAMGEYVIPALLGGDSTLMIGRVVFDEFFANRDWPVAAAVTVVLLLILVVPMMWFQHVQAAEHRR
jgi:putrescine transport system permease protein